MSSLLERYESGSTGIVPVSHRAKIVKRWHALVSCVYGLRSQDLACSTGRFAFVVVVGGGGVGIVVSVEISPYVVLWRRSCCSR